MSKYLNGVVVFIALNFGNNVDKSPKGGRQNGR